MIVITFIWIFLTWKRKQNKTWCQRYPVASHDWAGLQPLALLHAFKVRESPFLCATQPARSGPVRSPAQVPPPWWTDSAAASPPDGFLWSLKAQCSLSSPPCSGSLPLLSVPHWLDTGQAYESIITGNKHIAKLSSSELTRSVPETHYIDICQQWKC